MRIQLHLVSYLFAHDRLKILIVSRAVCYFIRSVIANDKSFSFIVWASKQNKTFVHIARMNNECPSYAATIQTCFNEAILIY